MIEFSHQFQIYSLQTKIIPINLLQLVGLLGGVSQVAVDHELGRLLPVDMDDPGLAEGIVDKGVMGEACSGDDDTHPCSHSI